MKEHRVIHDGFTWIPPEKRKSRFGGGPMPPRKPETRLPLLWLVRDEKELYLVNLSGGILDLVTAETGGFQMADDTVLTVSSKTTYTYRNVKHNSAVKVDEYDGFLDLDFVLQVGITVRSEALGDLEISSPSGRGGIGEAVLLWNTGESGKDVSITIVEDS